MLRRRPCSTRTYTLFPDTTLFRSSERGVSRLARYIATWRGRATSRTRRAETMSAGLIRKCSATRRWISSIVILRRSEEHTSELQSLMRVSYAVFCLKKKNSSKQETRKETSDEHTIELHNDTA